MFSFLIGLAAGITVILNGPQVRRGIAKAVLTGGDLAAGAGKEAKRLTSQLAEDFEDAMAEAKAEKEQAQAAAEAEALAMNELAAQLRQMRADIASLESKLGPIQ